MGEDELVSFTLHCIDTVSSMAMSRTLQRYNADLCITIAGADGIKENSIAIE